MTKQMSEMLTLETRLPPPCTFPGWGLTLSRQCSALCKLAINVMLRDWKSAQRSCPAPVQPQSSLSGGLCFFSCLESSKLGDLMEMGVMARGGTEWAESRAGC